MDNVYTDTGELVAVVRTITVAPTFFLTRFFSGPVHLSTKEHIVFDEVFEDMPIMAPFVSPLVGAKPQRHSGAQAKSFKPAYVKPKHMLKPGDFIKRRPGEELMGQLTPQDRMDLAIVDTLARQKRSIVSRWEWLAAKATIDGKVVIASEDYPAVEVDFGRKPSHDITIVAAGEKWDNAAAPIKQQLEEWSALIFDATGYAGTDVLMSPEAWVGLENNTGMLKQLELRRGVTGVPNISPMVATQEAQYKGQWGEFHFWVYKGQFKEQDGSTSRVLDAGEILMTSAPDAEGHGGIEGVQAFGMIQDVKSMEPLEIFPKTWVEEDPSGTQAMSQSAPLMIPGRPNATVKVKVQ